LNVELLTSHDCQQLGGCGEATAVPQDRCHV